MRVVTIIMCLPLFKVAVYMKIAYLFLVFILHNPLKRVALKKRALNVITIKFIALMIRSRCSLESLRCVFLFFNIDCYCYRNFKS